MFQRIAILGMGLIGSSLARAVRGKIPGVHIAAFDVSHEALALALAQGFADSQHAHAGQAVHGADLVVLASPSAAFATLAKDMTPFLEKNAVVTDTASVKRYVIAAVTPHIGAAAPFVPGHPIAGSEKSGAAEGHTDLFAGRRVILTPEESALKSEPVARVRMLWEAAGARVEYMPADVHDRIYAYVSHLPHLVAFAARLSMRDLPPAASEEGGRFVRLMRSDPALWADICLANADCVDAALGDFTDFARQMQGELSETPAAGGADARAAAELFPRVVATCLIATASLLQEATGVHPARYAGQGFTDMTAPALSDPEAALSAISSHHWVIANCLGTLLRQLHTMREALRGADKAALIRLLQA